MSIRNAGFRWTMAGMVLLLLFDLLTKIWVRETIPLHQISPLLPPLLDLTHVQNRGVSFSVFADLPDAVRIPLLVGVSVAAVLAMLYYQIRYWKRLDLYTRLGLAFIIPGAVGNLIDRVQQGYVTDFIHFRWYDFSFFVNNVADCLISIGVVGFLITILRERKAKRQELETEV